MDALRRASHHFNCHGHRTEDGQHWLRGTVDWAVEQSLRRVVLMAPQVGDWEDPIANLMTALHQKGIATDLVQRNWDTRLFPHARAGFFKFKKSAVALVPGLLSNSDVAPSFRSPLRLVR